MLRRIFLVAFFLSVLSGWLNRVYAQPMWTINLLDSSKRSQQFENRKLGSEKMADKKFTPIRHFFQNNYTHYNYYYNASNKLSSVIEKAKLGQKEDFTKLLPYYPYTLDATAAQKIELDSIIYKSTAGILLHDLRNDWIDNMYLLMGQAYFFKKQFDSAVSTFQFINYNLFPRKKKEDDDRIVGTSDAAQNSTISIANKEKRNILQKLTAKPPSRNDAFIWMIRTLIEQDELSEAAGLISTLEHDPNFPNRLRNDLDEVTAYWFYKQKNYDSAAVHLEKALSTAETKQDRSRAEFLLAQLYELSRNYDKASTFYNKATKHTTDPVLDIYARLNNAKMRKGTGDKELDNSIDNLVRMARKDKFDNYREILYYAAGDLAMQKPDTTAAIGYFNKSIHYNEKNNVTYKNSAFLQLADIAFNRRQYKAAQAYYDSLQLSADTSLKDRLEQITLRKNALTKIVDKITIIEREDSLQKLAAMPQAERELFVKKLVKRLRKEKGLKEDDNAGGTMITFDSKQDQPVDLFAASNSSKGAWYFYNDVLKAKGLTEFKRKWGTRTNTDNWRRKSAAENAVTTPPGAPPSMNSMNPDDADKAPDKKKDIIDQVKNNTPSKPAKNDSGEEDISFEGLMANIPLTSEQLNASINLHAVNLYELGNLYKDELEDHALAIETYELSLQKHPDSLYNGGIYFGLYYCYNKTGNISKANYYKNLLNGKFATSHFATMLNNPAAANTGGRNQEGTKRYEAIYNLFIEGKFEQALAEKKIADSIYKDNYWTPQLLYIEAVYLIRQRKDSLALNVLYDIIGRFINTPMKVKAERLVEVLVKRAEIEAYLSKLEVTRVKDEPKENLSLEEKKNLVHPQPRINNPADSNKVVDVTPPPPVPTSPDDAVTSPPITNGTFTFDAKQPQNVVMVLDKVDGTYISESKNAMSRYVNEKFRDLALTISRDAIDAEHALLIFSSFADAEAAIKFLLKIRKDAPDEISWLPAAKYYFLLMNDTNLQLLKTNKDIPGYRSLLGKQYPGKF